MHFYIMLAGTAASLVFSFVFSLVGILIYYVLPGTQYNLSWMLNAVLYISPFLGGLTAGWLVKKRGWINGGWIGLIYGIVVLILKVLLLGTANFSPLLLFMDFCLGCMGGICGVNGSLYYYKRKKEYKMGRY